VVEKIRQTTQTLNLAISCVGARTPGELREAQR
jgi:hypothetical protein